MTAADIRNVIEDSLAGLEAPVVSAVITPLYYQEASASLTGFFCERLGSGIYISLNKPASIIKAGLEKRAISTTKLRFVDCVTNTQPSETQDCVYMGKMSELTNLCMGVAKVVDVEVKSLTSTKDGRSLTAGRNRYCK